MPLHAGSVRPLSEIPLDLLLAMLASGKSIRSFISAPTPDCAQKQACRVLPEFAPGTRPKSQSLVQHACDAVARRQSAWARAIAYQNAAPGRRIQVLGRAKEIMRLQLRHVGMRGRCCRGGAARLAGDDAPAAANGRGAARSRALSYLRRRGVRARARRRQEIVVDVIEARTFSEVRRHRMLGERRNRTRSMKKRRSPERLLRPAGADPQAPAFAQTRGEASITGCECWET